MAGSYGKSMKNNTVVNHGVDLVYSGDKEPTTASLHDIDITTQEMENEFPTTGGTNVGVIVGIVITVTMLLLVLIYAYRRHKYWKKRRNSPYHVPIIEYKEESPSISAHSTGGYGTYRNLEECPINEDYSTKIEGKLTLQGLHTNA